MVALAWLLYAMLLGPTGLRLARLYANDGTYAHGFLVPLMALAMLRAQRHVVTQPFPAATFFSWAALLIGGLLMLVGHWYDTALQPGFQGHLFLRATGALAALAGMIGLLHGPVALAQAALPLSYLLFAVPLPDSILVRLTIPLQTAAAITGTTVLRWLGVPVYRDGNVIETVRGAVGIAEACSGIRSTWVFLAAAAGLAWWTRLNRGRTLVLLLAAPAAAWLGNALRVVITALLLNAGHSQWIAGRRHEALGMMSFVIGALLLLSALIVLTPRRGSVWAAPASPPAPRLWQAGVASRAFVVAFLGLVLGAAVTITSHYERLYKAEEQRSTEDIETRLGLESFPRQIGNWKQVAERPLTPEEFRSLRCTDWLARTYEMGDERVTLNVFYWSAQSLNPRTRGSSFHPHLPDWCYPGAGWTQIKALDREVNIPWHPDRPGQVRYFRKGERVQALLYWVAEDYPDTRWFVPERLAARLKTLLLSWNSPPRRRLARRYLVSVASETSTEGQAPLDICLRFANEISTILPLYGVHGSSQQAIEGY